MLIRSNFNVQFGINHFLRIWEFKTKVVIRRVTERGGRGLQWPQGPWASGRPLAPEGPSAEWHLEISMWGLKTFFFFYEDHLILTGKTVRISAKTFFFFWDHIIIWTKVRHCPSVFEFTKPEFRHIWAGLGPTFGSRRPWSYVLFLRGFVLFISKKINGHLWQ